MKLTNDNQDDPVRYVAEYYYTGVLKKTYEENIKLVNGYKFLKKTHKTTIAIPEFREPRGRPKTRDMKNNPLKIYKMLEKQLDMDKFQIVANVSKQDILQVDARMKQWLSKGQRTDDVVLERTQMRYIPHYHENEEEEGRLQSQQAALILYNTM
ncbi:hypothetical protein DY000_02022519 [Brassica cretica]|uniref:Uncharacterized protein n=1 Tax=Brassica cretica TaxID=69181 RepID=A0ABQ7EIK5_BRACR|nr:hypothetical protein DY000_02022519 [Brassica cretica]